MKMTKHLTLELTKKEFASEKWPSFLEKKLTIPSMKAFSRFFVKEKTFVCFGSWLCYDSKLKLNEFMKLVKNRKWSDLNLVSADFLIIFARLSEKKIFILTSQSGAFPCYFSASKERLLLSTDFAWIKNKLKTKRLDRDWMLDYLSLCVLLTERTVLEEIKQLPPATLLTIDENFNFEYKSTVDIPQILSNIGQRYVSREKYANDFIEVLKTIISERLKKINAFPFGCDLSSGLDVNLVAYILKEYFDYPFKCFSRISKASPEDTDWQIVEKFSEKHDLKVEYINADDYFPFSQQHELDWIAENFYPADHGEELQFQLLSKAGANKCFFEFNGDGGDEIYKFQEVKKQEKFALQHEYFWAIRSVKGGINEIITEKGKNLILSAERFQKKVYFPSLMPRSAVQINLLFFPIMIETGVRQIAPFNDPKMVRFSLLIPEKTTKWNLWKHRGDIFLPEQFKPKGHFQAHIDLFLTEKLDFVIQTLENSVLKRTKIVDIEKILKDLKIKNLDPYQNKPAAVLDNVIRLEYFLQKNSVTV